MAERIFLKPGLAWIKPSQAKLGATQRNTRSAAQHDTAQLSSAPIQLRTSSWMLHPPIARLMSPLLSLFLF